MSGKDRQCRQHSHQTTRDHKKKPIKITSINHTLLDPQKTKKPNDDRNNQYKYNCSNNDNNNKFNRKYVNNVTTGETT